MGSFLALGIVWLVLLACPPSRAWDRSGCARGCLVALPFALVALPLMFTRPGDRS